MNKRRNRLDLVKQVFANREQAVARELGAFQHDLHQAEKQLSQLKAYRDQQASGSGEVASTDPSRLQNQQAFRQRLNEAIAQQERLIQRARIEGAELRQRWLAKRRKTLSVEKLSDQRDQENAREELTREQKHLDETIQQAGVRPLGKF